MIDHASRIRTRLRELLARQGVTQVELCARLTRLTGETWHQQHMSKLLNGGNVLTVEQLALIAYAAGLSLVEVVREPGKEFVGDLTPTELRLLDAVRAHPDSVPALLQLLGPAPTPKPTRATIKQRMSQDRGW